MCPWVGSHAPSCGPQLKGLASLVEYLSPQGVLLPRVYGRIASPLWLELRGPAAWQAIPSWSVCRHAFHWFLPGLQVTFAMVPAAAWPGWDRSCHWPGGSAGWPHCVQPSGCGSLRPVPLRPSVLLCARCPGPLGACSPVRAPGVFRAPCLWPLAALVHRCSGRVRHVCAPGGFKGDPPLLFRFLPAFWIFVPRPLVDALVLLCLLFIFLCFLVFGHPPSFFLKKTK